MCARQASVLASRDSTRVKRQCVRELLLCVQAYGHEDAGSWVNFHPDPDPFYFEDQSNGSEGIVQQPPVSIWQHPVSMVQQPPVSMVQQHPVGIRQQPPVDKAEVRRMKNNEAQRKNRDKTKKMVQAAKHLMQEVQRLTLKVAELFDVVRKERIENARLRSHVKTLTSVVNLENLEMSLHDMCSSHESSGSVVAPYFPQLGP